MSTDETLWILGTVGVALLVSILAVLGLMRLGMKGPRWTCKKCGRTHRLPVRGGLPRCCMEGLLEMMPSQE